MIEEQELLTNCYEKLENQPPKSMAKDEID